MSWMKRRGHTTPSAASVPPVQMYNPNQHSQQEMQWQSQDLNSSVNNWYTQPSQNQHNYNPAPQQTNFWQPYNQQQYKQNVTSPYQTQYSPHETVQNQGQQPYYHGNDFQQQNVANDQFSQQHRQHYDYAAQTQNSAYGQQPQKPEGDSWDWGWGDEDNSNVQSLSAQNSNINVNQATNLGESFANEESWNWSLDETTSTSSTQNLPKADQTSASTSHTSLDSFQPQNVQNAEGAGDMFQKMGRLADKHRKSPGVPENVEKSADQAQSLLLKRAKMDHLTPQWSIESQLSQESSDDVLQTSESDKVLSRSSTISQSPISGHDVENLPQIQEAQYELHNVQDAFVKRELPVKYELENIVPSIRQHENKEDLTNVNPAKDSTPPPLAVNQIPPPPSSKNKTPPLLPTQSSSDDLRNPYKRTTGLSHKAASMFRATSMTPPEGKSHNFYQLPSFPQFTQSVNLETLPDNSEQPDPLPIMQTSLPNLKINKISHQFPDNNEVAPNNERNQYLETGQLSDENTNVDTLPPPGLRRMVLGQMENSDVQSSISEEPPPGICRIVLGQTEGASSLTTNNRPDSIDPPVGLHRMVPGESSSPESSSRPQYQSGTYQDDRRNEDYNSEVEMNQISSRITPHPRSATIGADTPPSVVQSVASQSNMNRSETIGADLDVISENRVGAVGLDSNQREGSQSENRRESIEGEPQDTDVDNLVSGVRDLTVGTDAVVGSNNLQTARRRSRQESTDSEREIERSKSPSDRRERRYKEERRDKPRERNRHTPEVYRDKKYDRRRYKDNRYEEDTDYYSDKERDRRRDERDRRGDYDKKYSSLRRDKDKEKRRRDPRDYERRDGRGRGEFYYGRYEDDYDDASRSRPLSRSDSLHDSYRERVPERDGRRHRDRDRERDYHRRVRDPFGQYGQGFGYDPYSSYYQQYHYQYYENLRRTNPQAYAEWYRKYYQQAAVGQTAGAFGAEDRASVHSGRSSTNEELKERYMRQSYYGHSSLPHVGGYYREPHSISSQYGMDESSYGRPFDLTDTSLMYDETTTQSQRLTPAKFSTAHVKAGISSGQLVRILPNYPLDGQSATVELVSLQHVLINDDEIKELLEFPGPLVKGVTHKKTIIEYCENKIRNAGCSDDIGDSESYILMWELMILLIRQNGMVVGTDIAELLMKDRNQDLNFRPSSATSNASSAIIEGNTTSDAGNTQTSEANNANATSTLKEEFVTNKFREYLLYGSGKEALEWAMKHGLWGHALFLASKLDKRTYANVMMRFANGLTMNDPLQTLYQLLSGRLPASVTCVSDEKWGDWRPHLAMILSNTTSRPELDRKAITTLADTLMSRGSLYAAQFCYLMAEVGFSRFGSDGAKLVLLGAAHGRAFEQFATNEAIHLTEVYEYACSLNDSAFVIPEFQPYKYLIATRLSDRGLLEKSLAYLERVSLYIIQNPSVAQPSFIDRVCKLADKLKYSDLIGDGDEGSTAEGDGDVSRPDNSWLKDLKTIQSDYNMGLITHESISNLLDGAPDLDPLQEQQLAYEQQQQSQLPDAWQQQQINEQYQQNSQQQQQWQAEQYVDQTQNNQQQHQQVLDGYNSGQYQEQQQHYWPNQQQWVDPQPNLADQYGQLPENQAEHLQHQHQQNDYWNNAQTEPDEVEKQPDEDPPRQQISMPNQSQTRSATFAEDNSSTAKSQKKASPVKAKSPQDKPASAGWFGGIWNRLALRPKNQMKLPDDKNPTIVWNPEKKKWVNLEEDGTETSAEVKPPPKMSEMPPSIPQLHGPPGQNAMEPVAYGNAPAQNLQHATAMSKTPVGADEAPKAAQPNMFKLQRGRNIKKSYIDVFNPGGGKSPSSPPLLPAPDAFGAPQSGGARPNFFVPAPVTDVNAPTDFLTPAPLHSDNQPVTQQQPQ